ncbi:MAG: hypothetical protein H0T51_05685 [Pirellulales bacterium]|nr:hypothetical protein [Pirellulales bacterium]
MRLFFALAMLSASLAVAEEKPVEIPLKSIWALDMPGTKDVHELDPYDGDNPTVIGKIIRVFFTKHDEDTPPEKCFVVQGEGKEALKNAADVLICNEPRLKGVKASHAASLVFYSYPAPGYVVLDSVIRTGNQITINYQVVVHQSSNVTSHFALIPLHNLPLGKITVKPVQVPAKESRVPLPDPKQSEQAVCDSCSFVVVQAR